MDDLADFYGVLLVKPLLRFCENLLRRKCVTLNLMNKDLFYWKQLHFLIEYYILEDSKKSG